MFDRIVAGVIGATDETVTSSISTGCSPVLGPVAAPVYRSMSWARRTLLFFRAVFLVSVLVFTLSCTRGQDASAGVYSADFHDYRGTRSTLPEGLFVAAEDGDGEPVGPAFYPFSGVFQPEVDEPFSGFGAFTADGESYSFGIRERGESDVRNARLVLAYTNETNRTVVGFRVVYDVETWIRGERDNRIRLKFHTDDAGFSDVRDIVSTVNPAGAVLNGGEQHRVDGSRPENRTSVDVSFLLERLEADGADGLNPYGPLAPGQTAYLRWQYSNARITDGETRSALALNNIRVEPMFAGDRPATGAAGAGSGATPWSEPDTPGSGATPWSEPDTPGSGAGAPAGAAGAGSGAAAPASAGSATPGAAGYGSGAGAPAAPGSAGSATPGAASAAEPAPLAFSRCAGFYSEPFLLELSSSLSGAAVYFTVDGSRPDPDSVMTDAEWRDLPVETRTRTFVYDRPIDLAELLALDSDISTIQTSNETGPWSWVSPARAVERAAVVRAVAISGPSRSSYRTETYFVADDPQERFALPVFSVATNRGSFFDPETGIYVPGTGGEEDFTQSNFLNRGTDWEREVHLEFFDRGDRVLRQDLGARIHGNFSRALPQKTLRLYSRSDYGTSRMTHRFFESRDLDDFNRLLLRNGGNDWYRTMLTDPIVQSVVADLGFDTQDYRPSILFLNGEYWGIHNIRERYDQHYLETNYGIPRDQVIILENDGVLDVGDEAFVDTFLSFRRRLADGEFESRDHVSRYLDLEPYLDYLATQIYAGNYDWPQNNIRFWRFVGEDASPAPSPGDGRRRVMMYDLDVSLGHGESLTYDMVAWTFGDKQEHPFLPDGDRDAREESFKLNQALMQIPEIRREFLRRIDRHLDTTFHPDRVSEHIDRVAAAVEPEMPRHIERWGRPSSMAEWSAHLETMHEFARERPARVREHLRRHFGDQIP